MHCFSSSVGKNIWPAFKRPMFSGIHYLLRAKIHRKTLKDITRSTVMSSQRVSRPFGRNTFLLPFSGNETSLVCNIANSTNYAVPRSTLPYSHWCCNVQIMPWPLFRRFSNSYHIQPYTQTQLYHILLLYCAMAPATTVLCTPPHTVHGTRCIANTRHPYMLKQVWNVKQRTARLFPSTHPHVQCCHCLYQVMY